MKSTTRALLSLTLLLAVVAAACDNEQGGKPEKSSERTVTLMTHDSFAVSDDVLAAFTKETGIKVKLLPSGDAGAALNQAILANDDPIADAFFGVDNTFLTRALDAGIFVQYEADGVDIVPAELRLDTEDRLTPIDYGDVCVNDDLAWFADRGQSRPETLEDLADPRYRDLLVVENPATSSPGLAFLLATIARYGEDGWHAYWERLKANGVQVTSGWEEAYNVSFSGSAGKGPRPLVVSYASSPPAEVIFADPKPAEAPTGVLTDTCFRQVELAGVLRHAAHPDEAKELIDFMLSKRFQEDVPLQMFVFPVRPDTVLPEEFTEFAVLPENPLSLPAEEIGAQREEWIDEWQTIVLR